MHCNSCQPNGAWFLQSFSKDITDVSGTEASGQLNPGAVKVMAEIGIDISGHTPIRWRNT